MPRTSKVWLSQEQQDDFERFTRSRTLAARWVQRSQILLMAAAHKPDQEIARALGITRQTVALWQERFVEQGVAGIEKDAPRSGRPRTILPPQIDEILRMTTRETPPAATHWSTRTLAQVSQVSFSTVGRILAGPRSQASPCEDVQAEQRSSLRGETGGRSESVPASSSRRHHPGRG